MEPTPHDALRDLLPDYAASYLNDGARAEVEAHLATCAECRAELAQWRTLAGWLAAAEEEIPPDAGAANGLAAIHARLGRTAGVNSVRMMERSVNHAMPHQDESAYLAHGDSMRDQATTQTFPASAPALREREAASGPASRPPAPQRRIRPWLAVGSVAVFLALVASLFYLLAPQSHTTRVVSTSTATVAPTAQTTATTAPTAGPTVTPHPYVAAWHTFTTTPTPPSDMVFSPSAPQTGYYCGAANNLTPPASSAQWLYRSDDGGFTWRPLAGITTPVVTSPATYQPAAFQCAVYVDAGDANDVLAQLMLLVNPYCNCAAGELPPLSETLWRSQDGGATWAKLQMPQFFRGWTSIIVSGSRLIGLGTDTNQVAPTCGTNPQTGIVQTDDLVASDDGGKTWRPIGQSIIAQGLSITPEITTSGGQLLQNVGAAVVVHSACDDWQGGRVKDLQEADWISTDGGVTWAVLPTGGGPDVTAFTFTPAASGAAHGVAVDLGSGISLTTLPIIRYSADSGATWTALPSLTEIPYATTKGVTVEARGVLAMPDGVVLASIDVYIPGANGTNFSSAIYMVDPRSANPVWTRYAPATGSIGPWAGSPLALSAHGATLWGTAFDGQKLTLAYLSPLP